MLNNGQKIVLPLKACDVDRSLAHYVEGHASWFKGHDAAQYLAEGRFKQGDRTLNPNDLLHADPPLILFRPPWPEPDISRDIRMVYESDTLLVVDKPAGIPITPTGDFYEHSLLHLLRRDFAHITPAHRLDMDTSGLILWVKQPAARGFYQQLFQNGRVKKIYKAMTLGRLDPQCTRIELPLGKDRTIYTKYIHDPAGKSARSDILSVTHWRDMSLLDLVPVTGRTNQLRAHLAAMGHPLVGDRKYYPDPNVFLEWLADKDPNHGLEHIRLPRHCLHCAQLGFPTPEGDGLHFESDRDVFDEWRAQLTN